MSARYAMPEGGAGERETKPIAEAMMAAAASPVAPPGAVPRQAAGQETAEQEALPAPGHAVVVNVSVDVEGKPELGRRQTTRFQIGVAGASLEPAPIAVLRKTIVPTLAQRQAGRHKRSKARHQTVKISLAEALFDWAILNCPLWDLFNAVAGWSGILVGMFVFKVALTLIANQCRARALNAAELESGDHNTQTLKDTMVKALTGAALPGCVFLWMDMWRISLHDKAMADSLVSNANATLPYARNTLDRIAWDAGAVAGAQLVLDRSLPIACIPYPGFLASLINALVSGGNAGGYTFGDADLSENSWHNVQYPEALALRILDSMRLIVFCLAGMMMFEGLILLLAAGFDKVRPSCKRHGRCVKMPDTKGAQRVSNLRARTGRGVGMIFEALLLLCSAERRDAEDKAAEFNRGARGEDLGGSGEARERRRSSVKPEAVAAARAMARTMSAGQLPTEEEGGSSPDEAEYSPPDMHAGGLSLLFKSALGVASAARDRFRAVGMVARVAVAGAGEPAAPADDPLATPPRKQPESPRRL